MKISEDNFVLHIRRRDESALGYAIGQYGGLVKSVVRKHLYPDAQAMFFEECVNDVFLGVWYNIDSYEPDKNTIKNWIAAIARFKAIDYGRKYVVIRCHESGIEIDPATAATDEWSDPVTLAEGGLPELLQTFMKSLSESDRELFWRVYVAEDSVADISRDTGIKRDVIYNRLSRGHKKLKKLYAVNERGNE